MLKVVSFVFLSFLSCRVFGQIYADHSMFAQSEGNNFYEIYTAFPAESKAYGIENLAFILVDINQEQSSIYRKLYELSSDSVQTGYNLDQFNLVRQSVPYRIYFIGLDSSRTVIDSLSVYQVDATDSIEVISDIQLAVSMVGSKRNTSPFYKNGLEMTPNPSLLFDSLNATVFYYLELYSPEKEETEYYYDITVTNSEKEVKYTRSKSKKFFNKSYSFGRFDILDFENGAYQLTVNVSSTTRNAMASRSKTFYVNTGKIKTEYARDADLLLAEFKDKSSEQLDYLFELMKYLASPQEISIYESLVSIFDKQNFLKSFFERRSASKLDAYNFYDDYMQKINDANERYATAFREGYKTDRGRVFILYGEPSFVNKYYSSNEMKPYEEWIYNEIEGGVEFIFGDRYENNDMVLLHSTKRGEISNYNWQDLLKYNVR